MSIDLLGLLAQMRAGLREIHTSGDDTILMANALTMLNNIIQLVQNEVNKSNEVNEENNT